MNVDQEFDKENCRKGLLERGGIHLNCAATKEHVDQIERNICTEKERCHTTRSRLPHKKLPAVMVNSSVTKVTKWLNDFPRKGGVSKMLSPRSISTGILMDHDRDCRCEFGQCVQTDEEPDPTNSMEEQATRAICLGSAGNSQGSYRYVRLTTGEV